MASTRPSIESAPRRPSAAELLVLPRSILSMFAVPTIGRISHLFPRWMAGKLKDEPGLTPPRLMLMWLLSRFEQPTMGQIAALLDQTPRAITRIVDGLEEEGLVERVADIEDGRIFRIMLTPAGKKRFKALEPKIKKHFEEMFSGLDKKEIRELIRITEKLCDHMAATMDES
jgi:DNA-binding MarR family transcriptional regulator